MPNDNIPKTAPIQPQNPARPQGEQVQKPREGNIDTAGGKDGKRRDGDKDGKVGERDASKE